MALSIMYWANYVNGHTKLSRKSESSVESGRVLRFVMDELRVITANVQASMKDTSYKVQVKHFFDGFLNNLIIIICVSKYIPNLVYRPGYPYFLCSWELT